MVLNLHFLSSLSLSCWSFHLGTSCELLEPGFPLQLRVLSTSNAWNEFSLGGIQTALSILPFRFQSGCSDQFSNTVFPTCLPHPLPWSPALFSSQCCSYLKALHSFTPGTHHVELMWSSLPFLHLPTRMFEKSQSLSACSPLQSQFNGSS